MTFPASVARGWWRQLAEDLFTQAETITGDAKAARAAGLPYGENLNHPGLYALLGRACAELYGWSDPRVASWFAECLALRHPSGAFGEAIAWDPFNDGTINPADTPYAITTTDYVGMHLLAGYDHGIVSQADVDATTDAMLAWPQTGTVGGIGYPDYSSHPNDHGKGAVWNIVASAGAFLMYARTRTDSTRASACLTKGVAWRDKAKNAYSPTLKGWPYMAGLTVRQDGPHNAVLADTLQPWVGGTAAASCAYEQIYAGPLSYGEGDYIGGCLRLLYLASCQQYIDHLVGRVAHESESLTSAGARAAWAFMAIRTHTAAGGTT